MGESKYVQKLRKKIGHDLLLMSGVAAIIRDASGRILVQRTKSGSWNLPAGAIDPGEKPARAIVREIFEETGLLARAMAIVAITGGGEDGRQKYENGDLVESTTIVFACEVVGGQLKPHDDETARLEYFSVDELPPLPTEFKLEIFAIEASNAFFEWDESWLDQYR
jgi:8-oxo-dGTP pyrophosphatase MutT (NUDIX family)